MVLSFGSQKIKKYLGKKGEIRNWVHQWTYLIMWYQWTMNPLTWVINKAEICRVCLPWCVRHRGKQSQWKTKVMSSHLPYLSYIDPPLKTLSWCQSSKPGQCLLHTVTAHRSWITLKICVYDRTHNWWGTYCITNLCEWFHFVIVICRLDTTEGSYIMSLTASTRSFSGQAVLHFNEYFTIYS